MARVSIYISDELKARMAETGEALNWSDIARPVFENAIADYNRRKGQNMPMTDMRLNAIESRLNFLEGQEMANRSLLTVLARTLSQTAVNSVEEITHRINSWEEYFRPARSAELPDDHTQADVIKREQFFAALDFFFEEARKAIPQTTQSRQ